MRCILSESEFVGSRFIVGSHKLVFKVCTSFHQIVEYNFKKKALDFFCPIVNKCSRKRRRHRLHIGQASTYFLLQSTLSLLLLFLLTANPNPSMQMSMLNWGPTIFRLFVSSISSPPTLCAVLELVKELVVKSQPSFFAILAYIPHIKRNYKTFSHIATKIT